MDATRSDEDVNQEFARLGTAGFDIDLIHPDREGCANHSAAAREIRFHHGGITLLWGKDVCAFFPYSNIAAITAISLDE